MSKYIVKRSKDLHTAQFMDSTEEIKQNPAVYINHLSTKQLELEARMQAQENLFAHHTGMIHTLQSDVLALKNMASRYIVTRPT